MVRSLFVFVNFCNTTDNHEHSAGNKTSIVSVDLPDGDKPFILSVSLGLHNVISSGFIEKGNSE